MDEQTEFQKSENWNKNEIGILERNVWEPSDFNSDTPGA